MNWRVLSFILIISLVSTVAMADALPNTAKINVSIDNEPAHNQREQTLRVTGPDGEPVADVYVHARYYPRTTVQRGEAICKTGEDGLCKWTPQFAGLVRIRVDEHRPELQESGVLTDREREKAPLHTQTFSIRFDGPPVSGIVMFLFAFTILFGSLTWSLTELLVRAPRREAAAAQQNDA